MAISVNIGTLKCAGRFILYISLAEILVFSNDSYFFVNIENIERSGSLKSASLTFLPGWLSAWNF